LRRDPARFDAADYPGIDKKTRILLNDQASNRVEALDRELARAVDRAGKEAEKAHQTKIDEADYDAWQGYYTGDLTIPQLEDLATQRQISEEAYKAIRAKMEPDAEKTENSPLVIGELAEQVEMGLDVRAQLKAALQQGHIKTETYITMSRQVANREYKQGSAYISRALKPTAADKWSPDKNLRYAEAMDRFNDLVTRDMPPIQAAKEVVKAYTNDIRRTFKGLRKPAFMPERGDKESYRDLEMAEALTVAAFEKKNISETEYQEEIDLINELKELALERENADSLMSQEYEKRSK